MVSVGYGSGSVLSDHERKNLAILESIRRGKTISRTDISRITGLNIVTVSNYINDYIKKGLIIERGYDSSTGGRRPTIIELKSSYAHVIGVDLALDGVRTVLTDLEAKVIASTQKERPAEDAESIINCITRSIEEVIKTAKLDKSKVKGICVAASGLVDKEAGTVHSTVGTTSVFLPINLSLERKLDIDTFIENDATAAAYGEWALSLDLDTKVMLYMYSGVGCGIVINGEVFRGAAGVAGETSLRDHLEPTDLWIGKLSALGPWAAHLGIPDEVKERIKQSPDSKILKMAGKPENITLDIVFKAAKENDKLATEAIEKAGGALGVRIAFLVNLLNPDIVVIGGGIEQAGSLLLDSVRKSVKKWAFEEMAEVVKIIPARLGNNSVALGAATLVIRSVFSKV
ncbi:MAG: ROK family transcriptional regulator [Candidatus Omnitrophica bacterium]|nr:ROK family transcriptional regulator [Candidatus Omnitrophota bacterium]